MYVNDLPMITDSDSKVVFFADDTNIIITSPYQVGPKMTLNIHFLIQFLGLKTISYPLTLIKRIIHNFEQKITLTLH